MAVLIFWLLVLVALGNFADFLLGQAGGRRAKDRLVSFYIVMNSNSWSDVLRWTGSAMYGFMQKFFGPVSSVRYLIRVLALSLPASTAVGIYLMISGQSIGAYNWDMTSVLEDAKAVFRAILPFWVSGYAVDLFSWYIAQRAFADMSRISIIGSILLILWLAIAAYIAMVMTVFLLFTMTFLLFPENGVPIDFMFLERTLFVSFMIAINGLLDISNNTTNGIVVLPALIPYILFIIILMVCVVVTRAQSFVQRPLSIILQRAEESSKGVFTLVATAVASVIGILSAADRAFL